MNSNFMSSNLFSPPTVLSTLCQDDHFFFKIFCINKQLLLGILIGTLNSKPSKNWGKLSTRNGHPLLSGWLTYSFQTCPKKKIC